MFVPNSPTLNLKFYIVETYSVIFSKKYLTIINKLLPTIKKCGLHDSSLLFNCFITKLFIKFMTFAVQLHVACNEKQLKKYKWTKMYKIKAE